MRVARAQAYPTRPVRLILGTAAGSSADIAARLIGQWLSQRTGQQFIIENRPGAASNIATETVVKAPADGYTLLFSGFSNAINVTLYEKLNFDFIRDTTSVGSVASVTNIMAVHPSVPVQTVAEFIAYAKANPGTINMGSSGNGSGPHLSGELFKMMTGLNMIHVPYRGASPALTDLLGGQVQVMFASMPSAIEYIRAGRLRALAVTTAMRSHALPDIPILGDFVPGYEASSVYGVGAPKNTPPELIDTLNKEINAGLASENGKTYILTRQKGRGGTERDKEEYHQMHSGMWPTRCSPDNRHSRDAQNQTAQTQGLLAEAEFSYFWIHNEIPCKHLHRRGINQHPGTEGAHETFRE